MAVGARLCELERGDRVRVLGWVEEAGVQLDVVAHVAAVDRRPVGEAPGATGSVGVSLAAMDGPTKGFDEALPDSIAADGRLELFAIETADGWDAAEVWLRGPESGDFETIGDVQHVQRV